MTFITETLLFIRTIFLFPVSTTDIDNSDDKDENGNDSNAGTDDDCQGYASISVLLLG